MIFTLLPGGLPVKAGPGPRDYRLRVVDDDFTPSFTPSLGFDDGDHPVPLRLVPVFECICRNPGLYQMGRNAHHPCCPCDCHRKAAALRAAELERRGLAVAA